MGLDGRPATVHLLLDAFAYLWRWKVSFYCLLYVDNVFSSQSRSVSGLVSVIVDFKAARFSVGVRRMRANILQKFK